MNARIKFQKYGAMKFIGHLDVMRYFQKAFRRAGIDNAYTKGFSPHQIMSFAAPLGVGLTSDGEYMDVQLLSCDEPGIMIQKINAVLTEGFRVTGFHILKEREENRKAITAMSLVSSADYLVSLKDGYMICDGINTPEAFKRSFQEFYEEQEIIIDKKTKKSESSVDIKPMITGMSFEPFGQDHNGSGSVAQGYDNAIKVYLQLDTGSVSNLKPELVMEAYSNYLGVPYVKYAWQVHRLEIYACQENNRQRISLDMLEH
jgi:radical SAM-linked protein